MTKEDTCMTLAEACNVDPRFTSLGEFIFSSTVPTILS